jgi:hypothetical protein
MRYRKSPFLPAVVVATAVSALTVIMFVAAGLAEALVVTAVVAVLAGMYALRRYARGELIYRRPSDPAGTAPATGRRS